MSHSNLWMSLLSFAIIFLDDYKKKKRTTLLWHPILLYHVCMRKLLIRSSQIYKIFVSPMIATFLTNDFEIIIHFLCENKVLFSHMSHVDLNEMSFQNFKMGFFFMHLTHD